MQEIETEPKSGQTRVLVAEDNPMNQRVIQSLLAALGHEYDIVENGKEAVQAASGGAYDVVLMDISMPVMSGEMATRIIRAMDDDAKDMPIVALTAHAMKGDRERFLSAGFSDYLAKPIDVTSLSSVLTKHMGPSKAVA